MASHVFDDLVLINAADCRRTDLPLPDQAEVSPRMRQLWDYWNSRRGGRFAPTRSEIVPADLKSVLPGILLVDVVGPPDHFIYRLAGTAVDEAQGFAVTGKSILAQRPEAFATLLLQDMQHLVAERAPQRVAFDFTGENGEQRHYEVLRLPLSEDGEHVDRLLCFADFQDGATEPISFSPL